VGWVAEPWDNELAPYNAVAGALAAQQASYYWFNLEMNLVDCDSSLERDMLMPLLIVAADRGMATQVIQGSFVAGAPSTWAEPELVVRPQQRSKGAAVVTLLFRRLSCSAGARATVGPSDVNVLVLDRLHAVSPFDSESRMTPRIPRIRGRVLPVGRVALDADDEVPRSDRTPAGFAPPLVRGRGGATCRAFKGGHQGRMLTPA
jgi:hypothetical protein